MPDEMTTSDAPEELESHAKRSTRGPYARTARIREAALEASLEVFGAAGYWGATFKDVAEKAGITSAGLTYHFADKDALLTAALSERDRRVRERIERRVQAGAVDSRSLAAEIEAIVEENISQQGLAEVHTIISAESVSSEHPAHELFRSRYKDTRERLARRFELIEEQENWTPPLPPSMLAILLIAVADGVQMQWLLDRESVDPKQTVMDYLSTILPE